jgi:2,4-dienoyl-CoA reductase-like NADH-dependent reductase (Old Yellow Enzyme family)
MLGVRLSSERFGIKLGESKQLAEDLMLSDKLDFLDMSLWDCFKEPQEEDFKGKTLLQHFSELERGNTRLGVAGNIKTPQAATKAMEEDIDWVMLGRAAILNHNFPILYADNPEFEPPMIPVKAEYLAQEGLSPKFISYMSNWGFIEENDDK